MTKYSNGEKFRAEMVDAARKFFSSPRIKNTPFEEKKRYLLGRGITEEEISEAMKIGSCVCFFLQVKDFKKFDCALN